MFTGIITATGKITSAAHARGSLRVGIERPRGWNLKLGDSVNVNGVCSTVSRLTAKTFEVEYMPETLKITTAAALAKGACVNLERSLRLNDRLDGHLVQGHVDTTGTVTEIKHAANSAIIKIKFPARYKKFIAKKGSISVNGVSLTVVETGKDWFSASLVNYTLKHTNLQNVAKNDKVNLEVDMLARYLDALLAKK
jgi:riboflavin synthase